MSQQPRTYCLALVAVIICATTAWPNRASGKVVANDVRMTRFDDLLDRVIYDDAASRRDFAAAALGVMIDAYLTEIDAYERDRPKAEQLDASWRRGTLQYVKLLEDFAELVQRAPDVGIVKEPHGSVRFIVDAGQIMFHGPRASSQAELERALVEAVCLRRHCRQSAETVEDRVGEQMANQKGAWQFGENSKPTYTTGDGLSCVFQDPRHLRLKKEACQKIIYELRFVAEAFRALQQNGSRIDWTAIRIASTGKENPNKLVYNRGGAYFHARLPTLWQSQQLFRDSFGWLQARAADKVGSFVIRPPDVAVYTAATPR